VKSVGWGFFVYARKKSTNPLPRFLISEPPMDRRTAFPGTGIKEQRKGALFFLA
jgi:hypothetical protein